MTKFFAIAACMGLSCSILFSQGVNIGSNNPPDPSAGLEVDFNNKGFLLPRLTTAQRNGITNPAIGLQIYNTTTNCLEIFFPGGWQTVSCECNSAPPVPSVVNGPLQVCPGQQSVTFTVQNVPGATGYTWTVPNPDVLASGQGTNTITVDFSNTTGNRTISVASVNSCGTSAAYSITVNAGRPDSTFTISPSSITINNPATFTANAIGATYAWTFQSGSPASGTNQSHNVTWANTGTYLVDLVVTDNNGCQSHSDSLITVGSCSPFTMTFSNCGATGYLGPDQNQCNAVYGPGVVTVNNGIQVWTVPQTGTYRITVAGGDGSHDGTGYGTGGRGAIIAGEVTLNQGDNLKLLVGQQGKHGTHAGGGGGGTFVATSANVPLMVAGGGGSSRSGSTLNLTVMDGNTAPCGKNGVGGSGGCNGNGAAYTTEQGPGGAGFLTDGPAYGDTRTMCNKEVAMSFVNGGRGGRLIYDCGYTSIYFVYGGFGGGAAAGWGGAGGGGGYSGGGAGNNNGGSGFGGGGGSFVHANATNVATSNGQYDGNSNHNGAIQNLNNYNAGNGYITITRVCP